MCYLYYLFGSLGDLLYIGVSKHPDRRLKEHRARQPWGHDIVSMKTVCYSDSRAARIAEHEAIGREFPRYNKQDRVAGALAAPEGEFKPDRVIDVLRYAVKALTAIHQRSSGVGEKMRDGMIRIHLKKPGTSEEIGLPDLREFAVITDPEGVVDISICSSYRRSEREVPYHFLRLLDPEHLFCELGSHAAMKSHKEEFVEALINYAKAYGRIVC